MLAGYLRLLQGYLLLLTGLILSPTPALADDTTSAVSPETAARPNVVWIMSEDNSKHYLKHFDQDGAEAPHIEALARHGITFDHAFSCAPVCSVARTTLITSCYAPRIGTQFHRRTKMATLPAGLKMFPAYLRAAGYYTTNNSKEDYNANKSADVWDESSRKASWKNRPEESTPFFHVQTSTLSHESSLHFKPADLAKATKHDPDDVRLQPYFPDTPLFRYTRARYHDRIQAIDAVVGKIVAELDQAGQLENTFIFYFGDHGGVLPRSKGYAYESGLHIPLVVRVPDNFKGLTRRELGSRAKGFVEFVDFGPTVLNLAGVDVPSGVDGRPFLGKTVAVEEVDSRDEAFGYADRFDEKYELVRTLRKGKFKYIRNFEPFLPDGLQNNYRYKMLAYEEWRTLHRDGKLNETQSQFFQPKAAEALYDLEQDPHETRNLAADPQHAKTLVALRNRLMQRLKAMPDLSFVPEGVLYTEAMEDPVAFGQANQDGIAKLIEVANLALEPFEEAEAQLSDILAGEDPWAKYWALVACSSFGERAKSLIPFAEAGLREVEPLVVVRAVEFLSLTTNMDTRPYLYRSVQRATNEPEALRMLNTAVYLNDSFGDRLAVDAKQIQFIFEPENKKNNQLSRRMEYLAK